MCIMCDGATLEEARAILRETIDTNGWAVQAVHPGDGYPGWVYTVGLTERFGHPEFVTVACDLAGAYSLLAELVGEVETGASLVDRAVVVLPGRAYVAGPAHPAQFRAGLLGSWTDLYGAEGRLDLPLGAIVIEAPELLCPRCRPVDLRQPSPLLSGHSIHRGGPGPGTRPRDNRPDNRAQVRRRRRRR